MRASSFNRKTGKDVLSFKSARRVLSVFNRIGVGRWRLKRRLKGEYFVERLT